MNEVLMKINKNPGINQRRLASLCQLSLGKVNTLIDEALKKEWIKKEINGREHRYMITSKGLEYLEKTIQEVKGTVIDLHTTNTSYLKTAVILAAGYNEQFDLPVCLQSLDGEKTLIERLIGQLELLEIEKIIIVGGYRIEKLKECISDNILVIANEDYKWSGTMASLAKVAPYVDSDFLLVESDIVIETMGLKELINDPNRDSVLITSESGSKDEAFVEIRNHQLFKISKDITQLNRIDGEMIGVSKISYEYFLKMMEFYQENKNPYLNYEYLMLDVAHIYGLGYNKLDNLLWHEIDNLQHLDFVKKHLLKRIEKKEKMLNHKCLKELVSQCLCINIDQIKQITVLGGMTNKNYKITIDDKNYVLRVAGNGTEKMISRKDEIKNAAFAHEIGVDVDLIYFDEKLGIKISKFIERAETLSAESTKKPYVMKKVCQILNQLHYCGHQMENEFNIYKKIETYEQLLNELSGDYYEDYTFVKQQILALKKVMDSYQIKQVPCHNDTLAENFIKDEEENYYLIDWEYAGMNDPMWDVAAHCLENGFNADEEELFLKTYFGKNPTHSEKMRILINKIYQDFLWSIWTKVKEASGDDFGSYGIDRFNRAKNNLKRLAKELGV
ncbi:MAG: phosphotransferase [Ruminococcus sp.]|nr:phosphotransferase [Ruminococcus sp.]